MNAEPSATRHPLVDLLVIGAGPAGLATAIAARLAGLAVTVLDRAAPPIEKACGEGLMPDAVARLTELGMDLGALESFPFRGIRYVDGETVAEGLFPGPGGLGVRRLALHQALARRAAEAGADLRWGVTARGPGAPESGGVETDQGVFAARFVVGADGLHSQVRRWAGLEAAREPREARRFGVRRHYTLRPWSDFVEVHWGPACEAYVTPVAADRIGVALLWSGAAKGFDDLLRRFPALAERLAGAAPASRDRGAGPLYQRVRAVARGNVALVGDAAGYLDAITGEGLAVALHQAPALAAAIVKGDLAGYAAAHRRLGRLPAAITGIVLALERRPALRRRAIRALAAEPALFSRLLGIHGRTLPPRRLGLDGALRLAWRLVTP
ncbi:MAG TPA: NAD(P)/FAD-dependent oxidoreductase [Thermoanaerobaculia bacterium]|nr:NAD(P)/FAD-dependent oxidoreductase [Thermoanaerobaculia bacterium]